MTTIRAIRLASLVTAINVVVASGFSIAVIIRPQYLVPAESVPTQASLILAMYAAAAPSLWLPRGAGLKSSNVACHSMPSSSFENGWADNVFLYLRTHLHTCSEKQQPAS